jgi:hypothetical protein
MQRQMGVQGRGSGGGWRARLGLPLLAIAFAMLNAPLAHATFHEMSIREVYPAGDSSYVELQMWAGGQNFVGGHRLVAYDSTGNVADNFKFAANVANGANQSTILVADTDYPLTFDEMPAADETDPDLNLSPTGGAVCWAEGSPPDCVAWGNFKSGAVPLPSATGSPVAPGGVPAGMALRRSIDAGCSTFLELSDDRDSSAADFSLVAPAPRPNSVAPSERACPRSGGGQEDGGGAGGAGTRGQGGAPQTTLKRKPAKTTHDRTPTFRFGSDESGSSFQCKLDGGPYRACRSPFTTKRLSLGHHTFKVRARDDSGKLDPSPASYGFRVAAKR